MAERIRTMARPRRRWAAVLASVAVGAGTVVLVPSAEAATGTADSSTQMVTGGGNLDLLGGSATFGTNAFSDARGLRGILQINDKRTDRKRVFHANTIDEFTVWSTMEGANWSGTGRWNGEPGYRFAISVVDNRNGNSAKQGPPDWVSILIERPDHSIVWSTLGPANLDGNITIRLP